MPSHRVSSYPSDAAARRLLPVPGDAGELSQTDREVQAARNARMSSPNTRARAVRPAALRSNGMRAAAVWSGHVCAAVQASSGLVLISRFHPRTSVH